MGALCVPYSKQAASACVPFDREFAQKHFVNAQASIRPRVQVDQYVFQRIKPGSPEYKAFAVACLATRLLQRDFAGRYIAFQHFPDAESHISAYEPGFLVQSSASRKHSTADDCAGADDHIQICRHHNCCSTGYARAKANDENGQDWNGQRTQKSLTHL